MQSLISNYISLLRHLRQKTPLLFVMHVFFVVAAVLTLLLVLLSSGLRLLTWNSFYFCASFRTQAFFSTFRNLLKLGVSRLRNARPAVILTCALRCSSKRSASFFTLSGSVLLKPIFKASNPRLANAANHLSALCSKKTAVFSVGKSDKASIALKRK